MRKHRRGSSERTLVSSVVAIALVIVLILCATKLYEINQRKERLLEENRQLNAQKQVLIDKNNALLAQGSRGNNSDAFVEDMARDQLDMVYPGEIIFRTTGE